MYGEGALANVWVFRAVRAISEAQAQLPLLIQGRNRKGEWENIYSGSLPRLFENINPVMTYYDFTEAESIYMELTGNCFLALENPSPSTKMPREIWPIRPDLVRIHPDKETGEVLGYTVHLGDGQKPILYSRDEMIHRKYYNPTNWFWGASPLAVFKMGLTFEYYTKVYESNFFKHGVRETGILVAGGRLDDKQFERLRKQTEARYSGVEMMHRPMVLEGGLDWKRISVPPKDMEYKELKKWNKEEVEAIYNIPPLKMMDMEAASKLANAEIQERLFWSDTIIPRLKKREGFFDEWLLPFFFKKSELSNYRFRHDLSEVRSLQMSEIEKSEIAVRLIGGNNPIFSVDEVRERLYSLPPASWGGKEPLVSANLVPAGFMSSGGGGVQVEGILNILAEKIAKKIKDNGNAKLIEGEVLDIKTDDNTSLVEDKYSEEYIWSIQPEFDIGEEQQQYWREWAVRRLKEEDRFVRSLNVEFRRELNETLNNLNKLNEGQLIPVKSLLFDESHAINNMRDIYLSNFGFIMRNTSSEEMAKWNLTNLVDEQSPTVIEYGRNQASWFAGTGRENLRPGQYSGVTGTQLEKLENTFNEGYRLGESVEELTKRAQNVFAGTIREKGYAARRIARTETIRIANFSRLTQYQRNRHIVRAKQWLAQLDSRVEEICARLHGEVVDLEASFSGGYYQPPDPHVGCRCSILPVIREKLGEIEAKPIYEPPMSSIGRFVKCILPEKFFTVGFEFKIPSECMDYTRDEGGEWSLRGELVSEEVTERFKKMRIPPGWKQVVASTDPKAKVQVVGMDIAGRWQYRYSALHIGEAAKNKFNRLKIFERKIDKIRNGIEKGIVNNDSRAFLLKLEDKTGIRAGSLVDVKAKKKAYGLTTLQNEHVVVKGNKIILDFVAKKGIPAHYELEDNVLATWLKARQSQVQIGERLFPDIPANELNKYIKEISGKSFSIKDFRTFHGSRIAREELKQYGGKVLSTKEKKDIIKTTLEKVSFFLKNTPSMAKKAYIDPMVWDIIGGGGL